MGLRRARRRARVGAGVEALEAPDQHLRGVADIVERTLLDGLLEGSFGVVACGLRLGERGCECIERVVLHDPIRVFGHNSADAADLPVHCPLVWATRSEVGQGRGCGLCVAGFEMPESLSGGGDLLVVAVELVPAGGGDGDEDGDVEEHRQCGTVACRSRIAQHRAYSAAKGEGMVVFSADTGAGGALERGGRSAELGPKGLWCEERKSIEGFAEGREMGLSGPVIGLVEVVWNAFRGVRGPVPRGTS